jgi:hypothetical protein
MLMIVEDTADAMKHEMIETLVPSVGAVREPLLGLVGSTEKEDDCLTVSQVVEDRVVPRVH